MKEEVIAVFDIGKTNKKLLIFDTGLKLVSESEEKIPVSRDEDGFECDSIELIENWIKKSVADLARSGRYVLRGVNFTTYGATLVYLDSNGKRLTPVYNYLKPIDESVPEELYGRYGGKDEFCRRTASPALGMLNSGLQILWLKKTRPDIYSRVRTILHFPQYLSYLLTGNACSEHTSIGCHTALWDFDKMTYHQWVKDEDLPLPVPVPVTAIHEVCIGSNRFSAGTGLHDSSASLAPYFASERGKFLLLSTGTWCINMNPYNNEKLTGPELMRDCLCYMSVNSKPVKSSRLHLGHMHDSLIKQMSCYFKINENSFRLIKPDTRLMNRLMTRFMDDKVFITRGNGFPELKEEPDLFVFDNFIEGYHLLMVELSDMAVESVNLVIPENDETENIYITGGFSRNPLFAKLVASSFPEKKVFTSGLTNSTALGAASVILGAINRETAIIPDLGLIEVRL